MDQRKELKEVFLGKKQVSTFCEDDKEWLMSMAQAGSIHASWCLIEGMESEVFTQGEGEKERLAQMLYDAKERMSNEELNTVCDLDIDSTPFGVELVMRGDKKGASYIFDLEILHDLCDRGNRYAARQLYLIYKNGDEELGIEADEQKAKEYYELAGDTISKWDTMDTDQMVKELEKISEESKAYIKRMKWQKDKTILLFILFIPMTVLLYIHKFLTKEKAQQPTTLVKKQRVHRQDTIDYDKIEIDYDTATVTNKESIRKLKQILPGNPLVFIDGKRITEEDEGSINVRSIMGLTVIEGEEATELYGEEAKDGVLIIKTWNGPIGDNVK